MDDYQHSRTARAVLRSLVPVICPPEAHGLAEGIVEHLALTFGALPPLVRKGLGAGLVAYDLGAVPRFRTRARHLLGEKAERYYQSWERGLTVQVQLARALNQMMSLSCYEQPAMCERVGYRPAPWIAEVSRKRLTVFAAEIQRQEASTLAPDPLRPGVTGASIRARRKAGG
jgi:hypothetical protein